MSDQPDGTPQPSGAICLGTAFNTPNLKVEISAIRSGDQPGIFACGEAYYRRCGWDGQITAQVVDGQPCPNCERAVRDRQIGTLPKEYIVPVKAVSVYLEQVRAWALIEVPDAS